MKKEEAQDLFLAPFLFVGGALRALLAHFQGVFHAVIIFGMSLRRRSHRAL
ncbi:hypothetical protein [Acetobacter sp. DsW_063]|uniref:hypothetical protein n=1 Tax=Acetobacter sp. DsW_063 TaxID=1514894 RepID=UPI001302D1C0|nr:hypothetical protein [Acetobacter sp. DsW_063]